MTAPSLIPPDFSAQRLSIICTGSVNASLLPYWLNWLKQAYPHLTTNIITTSSAERFVTHPALRALVTGEVWPNDWEEARLGATPQQTILESADCFAVFPCTSDFAMRLAQGGSSSPALMALQMATVPVAIAASFPFENEVSKHYLSILSKRPNVVMTRTVPAFSVGKQSWGKETGFFLPYVLEDLEAMLNATGSR